MDYQLGEHFFIEAIVIVTTFIVVFSPELRVDGS